MNQEKPVQLKDIYKPLFEQVVVEFHLQGKTKGGIHLSKKQMEDLQKKQNPILTVVAIGDGVKTVKVGDKILPSPMLRPMQIPLIYNNAEEGPQHGQIHVSEIMGIVDPHFSMIEPEDDGKEKIIN